MHNSPRNPLSLILSLTLLAAAAVAQNSAPAKPSTPPSGDTKSPTAQQSPSSSTLTTQKDKVSYAIGMNVGKGLKRESIDVDPNLIMQGLKDALAGGTLQLTDEQAQATMAELQTQVREREQAKRKQEAEENKKAGDAFLAANKNKPGVVALPDGLQYKVLKEGTGPKPTGNDIVSANYKGSLINGEEFDSSYKRNEPLKIPVKGVIKGWTEALQLMPVGSKWELYVPSDLAYAERGAGDVIPPNATLVFEIELLSIEPPSEPQAKPAQPATPAPSAKPAQQ